MGEFKQYMYSNSGTEIDFLQGLIDLICSLDDGITCVDSDGNETSAADQFADLTSDSKAKVLFNFGNGVTAFHLERSATNNAACNYYYVSNYGHAVTYMASGSSTVETKTTREVQVAYYKSESFVWFAIVARANSSGLAGFTHWFGLIKHGTDRFVGFYDNNNYGINSTTYTGNDMSCSLTNVLNYSAGTGKIDYFEHTPVFSSNVKQFDFDGICSCTTVPLWSSIALSNGKRYLALGTNLLVELDKEE